MNKKILLKNASGSTFPEISKNQIVKIKLPLPPLPEQERIATFLSRLDRYRELLKQTITLQETYKKGLLKNLIP